jgi:hypothetical protein
MTVRPTLLNSCSSAATAAEARFRIDAPAQQPRATRVVSLDAGAADLVRDHPHQAPPSTRFLAYDVTNDPRDVLDDLVLGAADGTTVWLSEELSDADFVMLVATSGEGASAASAIGTACTLRGITTAGLVLGTSGAADAAVSALRPHARVLLVSDDRQDFAEVLSAVGA